MVALAQDLPFLERMTQMEVTLNTVHEKVDLMEIHQVYVITQSACFFFFFSIVAWERPSSSWFLFRNSFSIVYANLSSDTVSQCEHIELFCSLREPPLLFSAASPRVENKHELYGRVWLCGYAPLLLCGHFIILFTCPT